MYRILPPGPVSYTHLRSVPEIECHVQDTAQMIADSGVDANCAVVVARFVASPAFCIPTSVSYTHLDVYKRQVLYHTDENGKKLEPMELAYIDVPDEFTGIVIEKLGQRCV